MAAADLLPHNNDELEQVESWRTSELRRAGYTPDEASKLAHRLDIDLHLAVDLLARGCSRDLALRILL